MLLIDDGTRVFRAPQAQPPKTDNTQKFQGAVNGAQPNSGNTNPTNRNGGSTGTNQPWGSSQPGTNPTYIPAPPPVTVDDDITRKLNPKLAAAQTDADAGQARVNTDQKQLDALYDDMDSRGASAGKLARAKKLEEQRDADQKAFDAANAKVSALKTGTYSEQLKADKDTAAGSKKAADGAFGDFKKLGPASLGLKQGEELTDQQIAGLTPDQRAAYFHYLQAQSQAVNDQDKVNATTVELNRNYTQWQVYASDPGKYGDIADQGLKAVNDALRPLNLKMDGPEAIDPQTAAQNLAEINQIAPYYYAALDTSTAAIAAMHDILGAQVTLADKQAALNKWRQDNPYLMAPGNPYELAVNKARQDLIAVQQKAQPLMLDYGLKATYTSKLGADLDLQQAQTDQQTAQTNYAQWRAQYPSLAAPGNPLEVALSEANRKLTLAQQRASTADFAFKAASAQKEAYGLEQDARRIWIQANGDAICIGSTAQNVTTAYTAANDKAKAARTNADRLTLQAQKSSLDLQKMLAEENGRLNQGAVSAAQPVTNGSDMALVSYNTSAGGQPLAGAPTLAQAQANLQQSQTQLGDVEFQQKMAQYDIERYDFIAGLPENLKNPQSDDDKKDLQTKLAEFDDAHFAFLRENQFGHGPIDGQEALKQVRQDLDAEREKINSRGWMQAGTDWVNEHTGGDRSELETYLGDTEKQLTDLVARKDTTRMSDSDYQAQLHGIMDPYGKDFVRMTLGEKKTDDRWHTVNEVGRFATATLVGIVATVAGGGVNVIAGAAAAFAVYEAWDIGDDVTAAAHGGDMMADGHLSISGFGMLAITNAMGKTDQNMGDAALMAGQDVVMNTVSSLATGIGAGAGKLTTAVAAKWLLPQVTRLVPALSTRGATIATDMLSTSAGHTVSQATLGTGQETNTGVELAFHGKLFTAEGGQALADQGQNQLVYLGLAPFVGLGSGAIPKLALGRQATFDLGANFAQEEVRTHVTEGRDINENEAIAALIGTVPGTAMNVAVRWRAQPAGSDLVPTTNRAPGTDLAPVPRYIAHFDADGAPSLGLLGPDGLTTAHVNAPWQGGEPPLQVEVVETSIGADGKVQTDAAHRLTRNADGSYNGTRIDSDGTVTTYTTGGPGTGHPLEGIQLRNPSRFSDGTATDPDATTADEGGQPGTELVPVKWGGKPETNGSPTTQTGAVPPGTGAVPSGTGAVPFTPPGSAQQPTGGYQPTGMGNDSAQGFSAYDSLVALTGRVYSARTMQSESGTDLPIRLAIAEYNTRNSSDELTGGDWTYLRNIYDLIRSRAGGGTMQSQGNITLSSTNAQGDPLYRAIDAGEQGRSEFGYSPDDARGDTFTFSRAGQGPETHPTYTHSIYLNANLAHAPEVADFVVRNILDKPELYPGVVRVQVKGPQHAQQELNTIVIDVNGEAAIRPVAWLLYGYQQMHGGHFNSEVPELSEPLVMEPGARIGGGQPIIGASVVERPSSQMEDNYQVITANEGLARIESTGESRGAIQSAALRLAWRDAVAERKKNGGDLLDIFTTKIDDRLRQFGIDPTAPWKNLRGDDGVPAQHPPYWILDPDGRKIQQISRPASGEGAHSPALDDITIEPITLPPRNPEASADPADAVTGDVVPVVAPADVQLTSGQGRGRNVVRIQDPATGQPIEVRVDPRYAGRAQRMSGEDGVIPMDSILTPGSRQTELPAGKLPKWVLVDNDAGAQLYPLNRVGVLGKRGLPGVDQTAASEAVHAARQLYRQWAKQTGSQAIQQHGNVVVLAAAGVPFMALAGQNGHVLAMAGIVPGFSKLFSKLRGTPNPSKPPLGRRIVDTAKAAKAKFLTARRNLLYYAFTIAGGSWIFIPIAATAGGTHINIGNKSIPVPDLTHLDPTAMRIEGYVDLMVRGLPLAMVAFKAASSVKARWSGTKLKGMTLRLINGVTFTQNGALALTVLAVGTPHTMLGRISLVGFGLGQLALGIRGVVGARQSRKFGNFAASATRNPGKTKVIGPDISQKGRTLKDVADIEGLDVLPLAVKNAKFTLTTSHTVAPGEDWAAVASSTNHSESNLRQFNPTLSDTLNPGDQVFYPTATEAKRLLRQGGYKLRPGGRKVRTDTVDLTAAGLPAGARTEVKGTRGLEWKRFAHENGTSDVPFLILNRDAQLQAGGQASPPPLVFSRSTQVQGAQTWVDIARDFGTSVEHIREVNPQLNRELQPRDTVYYPTRAEIAALRKEMGDRILTDSIEVPVYGGAKLENTQGQTWKSAGKQTGVPAGVLQILNAKYLYLAGKKAGTYEVRKGEDWAKVAKSLAVAEATLKALNPSVQGQPLARGQTITVPTKVEIPAGATWDWVEKTIRMHGASRSESLVMTRTLSLEKLQPVGNNLGYTVASSGETWTAVAAKLGFNEASLKAKNTRLVGQYPTNIPAGTRLNIPFDAIAIPADADAQWVNNTLAAVGADVKQSLTATKDNTKTIQTSEIRVPPYSFEAQSRWSAWLSIIGSAGVATGSSTIFPVDMERWVNSKPLQATLAALNGGNGVAAVFNAGFTAYPNRESGNAAKKQPKLIATTQTAAGSTLAFRALTRVSALMGWLGSKIQFIARNNP